MKDVRLITLIKKRNEARQIVKEILDFGITEEQKLDIIYMLSLTLESNKCMNELANILKIYRENINKDEEDNNVNKAKNKILIS